MFTAALLALAKIKMHPKCAHQIDEWISMFICVCVCVCVYTHTVEYCSVKKKNKILQFVATWMDLEGFMLSEIGKT